MSYSGCSETQQVNIFDVKESFPEEEYVPQACSGDFAFSPFFPFVAKICPFI